MKKTWTPRRLALAVFLGVGLLGAGLPGCASDEPYTPPQQQPSRTLPRAPVVAPSGPASPWWWPMPDTWWPME